VLRRIQPEAYQAIGLGGGSALARVTTATPATATTSGRAR
jgi:hypothetical protein